MIYIKRFLYVLFLIITSILGVILMVLSVLIYPFITTIDYIVHGKLTKDYVMKVYDWLDDVQNKLKPE
jgi:uncharacterized membrane protein